MLNELQLETREATKTKIGNAMRDDAVIHGQVQNNYLEERQSERDKEPARTVKGSKPEAQKDYAEEKERERHRGTGKAAK